jgi:hypothetical protein
MDWLLAKFGYYRSATAEYDLNFFVFVFVLFASAASLLWIRRRFEVNNRRWEDSDTFEIGEDEC